MSRSPATPTTPGRALAPVRDRAAAPTPARDAADPAAADAEADALRRRTARQASGIRDEARAPGRGRRRRGGRRRAGPGPPEARARYWRARQSVRGAAPRVRATAWPLRGMRADYPALRDRLARRARRPRGDRLRGRRPPDGGVVAAGRPDRRAVLDPGRPGRPCAGPARARPGGAVGPRRRAGDARAVAGLRAAGRGHRAAGAAMSDLVALGDGRAARRGGRHRRERVPCRPTSTPAGCALATRPARRRPLSARLGPGLLGGVFDGLLRPLDAAAPG